MEYEIEGRSNGSYGSVRSNYTSSAKRAYNDAVSRKITSYGKNEYVAVNPQEFEKSIPLSAFDVVRI